MVFTKRDIKDRVVEYPHRYQLNPVSGQVDVYDLSPITGTVVEGGTAINKIYLQPIEDTLEDITTPKYGVATGTNSYVVTVPKITTLVIGLQLMVNFTNASTGATFINVNSLGNKSLIKAGGGSPKIKANGIYTIGYDGTSFQLLGEGGEYGTALATDVLSGKTIGTDNGLVTGTIPSRGASTITPSASAQTIASGQYLSGTQTISAVAGLSAGNIKNATVVGGVTGTYKGLGNATTAQVLATRTFSTATLSNATGTMVNRGAVTNTITTQGGAYTIPSGYHSGAGKVTASFANLIAGNVKSGVNVGGVVGSFIGGNADFGIITKPSYGITYFEVRGLRAKPKRIIIYVPVWNDAGVLNPADGGCFITWNIFGGLSRTHLDSFEIHMSANGALNQSKNPVTFYAYNDGFQISVIQATAILYSSTYAYWIAMYE